MMKGSQLSNCSVLLNIFHGRIQFQFRTMHLKCINHTSFHTLRPRQNGRHFVDDIFKCIFVNENLWIPITIILKFVPKGPINNIPSLVQIMAWRRPGDKPLSEPMMVRLPTHICVTRPQWVNSSYISKCKNVKVLTFNKILQQFWCKCDLSKVHIS